MEHSIPVRLNDFWIYSYLNEIHLCAGICRLELNRDATLLLEVRRDFKSKCQPLSFNNINVGTEMINLQPAILLYDFETYRLIERQYLLSLCWFHS